MGDPAPLIYQPVPSSAVPMSRRRAPDEPALLVGPTDHDGLHGLETALRSAGWSTQLAPDSDRARWLASIQKVSLVVIAGDRATGWAGVAAVRGVASAPIAVITDEAGDVVALLEAGVDAVLSPGEDPASWFARLDALHRRADHRWGPGVRYLCAADLVVDVWTQQCTLGGEQLLLSPTEYALLTFLMTRPNVALESDNIVCRVWGWMPSDGRNALRIIVNRLRRKLLDEPRNPRFIAAVRGIGYRFVAAVMEVADATDHQPERVDVSPLFDVVTLFAAELAGLHDLDSAAAALVQVVDAAGLADGMALFRVEGGSMTLVGSRHMPASWQERAAGGVPLDPSFASAQSVLSGQIVQFADVRSVSEHFDATARELAGDGFRACHFVPIRHLGPTGTEVVWGHLGLVRRSTQPFDGVAMAFLRSVCAVFSLYLALFSPPTSSGR